MNQLCYFKLSVRKFIFVKPAQPLLLCLMPSRRSRTLSCYGCHSSPCCHLYAAYVKMNVCLDSLVVTRWIYMYFYFIFVCISILGCTLKSIVMMFELFSLQMCWSSSQDSSFVALVVGIFLTRCIVSLSSQDPMVGPEIQPVERQQDGCCQGDVCLTEPIC